MQFIYIKKSQQFFVFTSVDRSLKPAFALELLTKVANVSASHIILENR